jgi:MinD-like ATPase involved in chromosome partitioning or flagellar assembly
MSQIISIHSFRGGTGKSNTVANIASTMARSGLKIGIIDADIQSPGIHVIFGFDEDKIKYSLNDYLWGRCNIQDTAYDVSDTLITTTDKIGSIKGKLFLIPSSIKAGEIARVLREGYDVVRLNEGFQELIHRLKLDYLFIDTHPGLNEETLLSIGISNILIVVLRPDSQDFQGTAVTVDVARRLQVPRMMLVVNKALPSFDFVDLRQQIETAYKAPVAGILPLSEEMMQLGSKGVFCLHYPQHQISHKIQSIVEQITNLVPTH